MHDHQLEYISELDRWCCSNCDYVLGDGREKLLAPCPRRKRKLAIKQQQRRAERPHIMRRAREGELL